MATAFKKKKPAVSFDLTDEKAADDTLNPFNEPDADDCAEGCGDGIDQNPFLESAPPGELLDDDELLKEETTNTEKPSEEPSPWTISDPNSLPLADEAETNGDIEVWQKPAMVQQLSNLFQPLGLQTYNQLVDQFLVQHLAINQSDFLPLVRDYHISRTEYVKTWKRLTELKLAVESHTKSFWIFSTKVLKDSRACKDNRTVCLTQEYEYADFSESSFEQFRQNWSQLNVMLRDQLSRIFFENRLCWIKIEKYLNAFLLKYSAATKTDLKLPHATFFVSSPHTANTEKAKIHEVLSVLFDFLRKSTPDEQFVCDMLTWVDKCCAVLLRSSTLFDHIMIINHALRLPSSVCDERVLKLIQFPPFSTKSNAASSNMVYFDHFLVVTKFLLSPVSKRSQFLKELEKTPDVGMNADNDGKSNWVLLEESGEEAECPDLNWHLFTATDLTGFLERIPFERLLNALSPFMQTHHGFLQSIAYLNHFLEPIKCCFAHYNMDRYAELRKLLSSYCVLLSNFAVNSFLVNFANEQLSEVGLTDRDKQLKVEVSALLLRCFSLLSWNVTDKNVFPAIKRFNFAFLSPNACWRLAYVLIGPQENACIEDLLQFDVDPKTLFLDGLNNFTQMDEKLQKCCFLCGTTMLDTLANIIKEPSFNNQELMIYITNALFYVSYISAQHKETYFKFGHNLISYLLTTHPELVTFYLNKINRNWEKMKLDLNQSLLIEISLDNWVPTMSDIELLLYWLESYDQNHTLNLLSRKILSFINWLYTDSNGKRVISPKMLSQVLNVILNTYSNVIASESYDVPNYIKVALNKSEKKSPTGSGGNMSSFANFAGWCWRMIPILEATGNHLVMKDSELKRSDSKPAEKGHFLYLYAALMSSDSSNHVYSLSKGGASMLKKLTINGFLKPAIYVLDAKLRFEFENLAELYSQNKELAETLVNICQGDSTFSQKVGWSASIGPNTELLSAMLVALLQYAQSTNKTTSRNLMEFLVSVILSYPNLSTNYYMLYLLEQICFFSFISKGLFECVEAKFKQFLEELQRKDDSSSKSFKLPFSSSTKYFVYLPCYKTYPEFGFVSYFSLVAQISFENVNNIWSGLMEKLSQDCQMSPATALKQIQVEQKLSFTFSDTCLSIYLAQDCLLLIKSDHLALPLIAQLFFSRYFHRPKGLTAGGSVPNSLGERFFNSYYYTGTIKKLKSRFEESANCWKQKNFQSSPEEEGENSENTTEAIMVASSSYDLKSSHQSEETIAVHFEAFSYWADEPRLHTSSVVLEKLPDNYLPKSLIFIIKSGTKPMEEFVREIEKWNDSIRCMKVWHDEICSNLRKPVVVVEHFDFSKDAARSRIDRIKSKFTVTHFEIPSVTASLVPLSAVDKNLLISNRTLMEYFARSFNAFTEYAQKQVVIWKELNSDFDKFAQLTPQQYENKLTTLQKVLNCETMLQRNRCTGPVVFDLSYNCKSENLTITFELERLWKKIMEAVCMEPKCDMETISVVQIMEEIINGLIVLADSATKGSTDHEVATRNALDLFFLIANITSKDVLDYPPFRKVLDLVLTALGSHFVVKSGESQDQLLDLLLTKPYLVLTLNAYFSPELASGKFCAFYQKLSSRIIAKFDKSHAELLLAKFDVSRWLLSTDSTSLRATLLACVFELLGFCGKNVPQELNWTFRCASGHAFEYLNDDFVAEFPAFLIKLVNLSLSGRASIELWDSLLEFCGLDEFTFDIRNPNESRNSFTASVKTYNLLKKFRYCDFVDTVSDIFQQIRVNNIKTVPIKLFGDYIGPMSKCMVLLAKIVTHCVYNLQDAALSPGNDSCLLVWNYLTKIFSPFMAPFIADNRKLQLPKPTTVEYGGAGDSSHIDKDLEEVCHAFVVAMLDAMTCEGYSETLTSSPGYLHHFLLYFNRVLCLAGNHPDVMSHYFAAFLNLPWRSFIPHVESVNALVLLRQHNESDPKEFVAGVYLNIDWNRYCHLHTMAIMANQNDVANTALHQFLLLSILLETDQVLSESTRALIINKLESIKGIKLHFLSADYLHILTSVYLKLQQTNNNVQVSLKNPVGTFRLLLECSGFISSEVQVEQESSLEHKLKFMEVVCLKALKVTMKESLFELVQVLFSFISSSMDPSKHSASAILHLFMPLVKFINTLPFDQQIGIALEGFKSWATQYRSHYFFPLLIVSFSQNIANLETMPHYIEFMCESYFRSSPDSDYKPSWDVIINSLDLPSSGKAEFLSVCSKNCFYFVLNSCLKSHFFTLNQSSKDVLNQIFTWLNNSKSLTSENEEKAFLLFTRSLERLEKFIFERNYAGFIEQSRILMSYLSELSEERDSSGLRGMIGFGTASKLSQRFRISCRILTCFLQLQVESASSAVTAAAATVDLTDYKEASFSASLSKKLQNSQNILKNLKPFLVIKDYPEIATDLQQIVSTYLTENARMDSWKDLMSNMISNFYKPAYSTEVLIT